MRPLDPDALDGALATDGSTERSAHDAARSGDSASSAVRSGDTASSAAGGDDAGSSAARSDDAASSAARSDDAASSAARSGDTASSAARSDDTGASAARAGDTASPAAAARAAWSADPRAIHDAQPRLYVVQPPPAPPRMPRGPRRWPLLVGLAAPIVLLLMARLVVHHRAVARRPIPTSVAALSAPAVETALSSPAAAIAPAPVTPTAEAGLRMSFPGHFTFNDASPSDVDAARWDELRRQLQARCPTGPIDVAGYTCNRGTAEVNRRIARSRASSVARLLVAGGVPAERLVVVGLGSQDPIASNHTDEGRAANRRVVISCQPEPRSEP